MRGWLDKAYAAKAWYGAAVIFVTQAVAAGRLALADEAISLNEVEGLQLLAIEALGLVAAFVAIFRSKNAPPTKDGSVRVGGG